MAHVLTAEETQQLIEVAISPLRKRIAQLEATTEEWVDTRMALKLTGIKSPNTLRAERFREDTKLEYKKNGKRDLYSRTSCVLYNEAKQLRRHMPTQLR